MIDYHIHSNYSDDGHQTLAEICEQAITNELREIAITDHVDIEYPYDADFNFDFDKRALRLAKLREQHRSLIVRDGIEIGITPNTKRDYVNLLKTHAFDVIIASVHIINGMDPYYPEFFENRTKDKAYRDYLEAVLDSVTAFDDYSVLGHLGYAARFYPEDHQPILHREFPGLIDAILKTVIKNNKGIEVNTKGIGSTGDTLPGRSILERYYELGGEIITIGSDAHYKNRIGEHVTDTLQTLKEIGFKSITGFKNLQPIQIDI